MLRKAQKQAILAKLEETYKDTKTALNYNSPFELLVAVILSAQCTDERVNVITARLFPRLDTPEKMGALTQEEMEAEIRDCGLYHAKAKNILGACHMLVERFNSTVPSDIKTLMELPGVGRKTANLILGDIFGQEGYVCDTHCIRITGRLGITDGSKDPLQVERQLRQCIPPKESSDFCHRMVLFGRDTCTARSPKCGDCPLAKDCASAKAAAKISK